MDYQGDAIEGRGSLISGHRARGHRGGDSIAPANGFAERRARSCSPGEVDRD